MPHRRDRAVVGRPRGRADPARARQAMESAEQHLVQRDDRMILLLTPPFDTMTPSPGYIQGYVPGVRENGGQYTHAALWTVLAFARLGDGDRAAELFSMLNPLTHTRNADEIRPLSRRTLRRRRRRLLAAAAHRPRRLDVVHRVGGLDVSRRRSKSILGSDAAGGALHIDPCIPQDLAALRDGLQARPLGVPHRRREPERRESRRRAARTSMVSITPGGTSRSSTMARCGRCGWCWANESAPSSSAPRRQTPPDRRAPC